jgi:ABC-2 type transport system ATP-binding protein
MGVVHRRRGRDRRAHRAERRGKTSTLRCIVGIQAPARLSIGGHDIVRDPVPAKRQLAFMADEPQLFDYLTVLEHRLTARIIKSPSSMRGRSSLDGAAHRRGSRCRLNSRAACEKSRSRAV